MPGADEANGPATFECHRCGACCTNLRGRGRTLTEFQRWADGLVYRLPTEGGLRVFAWEAGPFPDERLEPMLAVAEPGRDQLVVLAYELQADVCPLYDTDEAACTIYEDRPLVCRAFPLLVGEGSEGLEVAASSLCGARVELAAPDGAAPREALLAQRYPDAFAPALAVPALVDQLVQLVTFLATAGALDPERGLEREDVEALCEGSTVSIVDRVEASGVLGGHEFEKRAQRTVEAVRDRWAPSATP